MTELVCITLQEELLIEYKFANSDMPKFNEFCCAVKCISKELNSELRKESETISGDEEYNSFNRGYSLIDSNKFQKKFQEASSAINRISQLVFTSKLIKGKSSFFDSSNKKNEMNIIRGNIYKVKKIYFLSLLIIFYF